MGYVIIFTAVTLVHAGHTEPHSTIGSLTDSMRQAHVRGIYLHT